MQATRTSPAPARYVGLSVVVALHLAGVYALSVGLIKPPSSRPDVTIHLPRLPDKPVEPPAAPRVVKAAQPTVRDVLVTPVPPIENWTEPPTVTATTWDGQPTPPATTPTAPALVAPPTDSGTLKDHGPKAAGAVCSVMPRPDVPALHWSGEAVVHALATVKGGRVVGSELRVTQGAMDAKTRRALQRAVEDALQGYQCQGDVQFQQDFAFRVD